MLDNIHCKFRVNSEESRRSNNKKLINSLIEIDRRDPFLSPKKTQGHTPKSLINDFVKKQINNKIMQ